MTVTLDEPESDSTQARLQLASWSARAGAIGLDAVAPVMAAYVVAAAVFLYGAPWWAYALTASVGVVVAALGRWLLPSLTGWSWGRAVFAIQVQRVEDGAVAGLGRLIARDLAHLLDTLALLVGWLWPLWDARKRTFADMLLHTEVRVVAAPGFNARKRAAVVLLGVLVVCLAAGALGLYQFQQDRAFSQARQQISDQGPRIVEQVLSYGSDSYKADFAKAQSLVTAGYRDQLVRQQQVVLKGGVTTNDYWSVSSAVLNADADKATMLIALQGQRGGDPRTLKFITATVRVNFVKSDGGAWQLSDLAVLKRPQQAAQQISPPQPPAPPQRPAGATR